jgi:uncharacterized repeat protein (TIGR03943 family)
VNRNAQAVVLTAIGAVALRVGATDEHTQFVNGWMQWPLVVSGLLLVGLAFTRVFDRTEEDGPTTPAAWAILLPVIVAFVVQPPALGAYVADRRVNEVGDESLDPAAVAPFSPTEPNDVLVSELVALAATYGEALEGNDFRLTGFVTRDGDDWFVTRIAISCCAADAAAFRVRVDGVESPPEEQWVEVVGAWVAGTGVDAGDAPAVSAATVRAVDVPKRQYE